MSTLHFSWIVLNSVWQSAAIAIAVAVGLRVVPRTTAAQRYTLWFAVLVAASLLPLANLALPSRQIAVPVKTAGPPAVEHLLRGVAVIEEPPAPETRWVPRATSVAPPAVKLPDLPLALWFAVSGLLLLRLAYGYTRLCRAKASIEVDRDLSARVTQSGDVMDRRVYVGRSHAITEPCVIGFLRPAIALPPDMIDSLDGADLERVLRHEYAHVQRYDDYINLAQHFLRAVFFFNPVVHIAARGMSVEREIACDDVAASVEKERVAFAKCLYEIARAAGRRRYSPAAGFIGGRRQIVLRVARLLEHNHNASSRLGGAAKGAAAAVLLASFGLACVQLTAIAASCPGAAVVRNVSHFSAPREHPHAHLAMAHADAVKEPIAVKPAIVKTHTVATWAAKRTAPEIVWNVAGRRLPPLRIVKAQIAYLVSPARIEADASAGNSDLLDALTQTGFKGLSVDDLIDLANHGVTAEFVQQLHHYGLTPMPVQELVGLIDHGVTADFIGTMEQAGYGNMSPEALIDLANHGVTGEYVRDVDAALNQRIAPDYLRRMADAGVTAQYVSGFASLGYGNLAPEDYVRLSNAGVTLDFARRIAHSGLTRGRPSVEDLIKLSNAGV